MIIKYHKCCDNHISICCQSELMTLYPGGQCYEEQIYDRKENVHICGGSGAFCSSGRCCAVIYDKLDADGEL